MRKQKIFISIGGKMTKSLIVKALAVVVAVLLLQLAVAPDSKAQQGYGGGYGGGGGGGGFYYTVQYGDTLFAICRKLGVNPYEIARVNGLPNPNYIYAGQVLYIPASGSCPSCGGGNNYPQPYPSRWQGGGGCGNNCYQQGCGNNCNNSGYGGGCGNNCNNSGNGGGGCGNNCNNSGYGGGCGNNCNNSGNGGGGCGNNCYQQGSGYDYTGYYYTGYYPNYQRYSYTCGYNYNCY